MRRILSGNRAARLVALAWVAGITAMVAMASKPDPYKLHVMDIPAPHPFPWREVVVIGVIMTAEAFLLWLAVAPSLSPRVPIRSGLVAALFGIGSFVVLLGSMHSGNAYWVHMLWLFALTAVTLLVTLGSAVVGISGYLKGRGG